MSAAVAQALSPVPAEKPRVPVGTQATQNQNQNQNEEARWRPMMGLPCQLTVELPLAHFKVADFLAMRVGSVLGTDWKLAQDIPLRINGTVIGFGEFEGAGVRLAVRLTELA